MAEFNPELIELYYERYGGSTRDERADRMFQRLPPEQFVQNIPQPNRLIPLTTSIVNGVRFRGYVERETAANRDTPMRRVRSQRNEDCESYDDWMTDRSTVYHVGLAPDMRTAISCDCPDAVEDNDYDKCKHMILCEQYMTTRVPITVRRSARARQIRENNERMAATAARQSRIRRPPVRYVPTLAPIGASPPDGIKGDSAISDLLQ